jgi:hypothetical protein
MNPRSTKHYRRAFARRKDGKDAALSLSAQLMLLVTSRQWRLVGSPSPVAGRTWRR